MNRARLIWLLVVVLLIAFVAWIADNTTWAEVKVPMLPKGEAAINPFYATQRFAEALGARTSWDRVLTIPRPNAVLVVSAWHWSLSANRRDSIERWVESGGRLVVDRSLIFGDRSTRTEFEQWSKIARVYGKVTKPKETQKPADSNSSDAKAKDSNADDEDDEENFGCHSFWEEQNGIASTGPDTQYRLCAYGEGAALVPSERAAWTLTNAIAGTQVARMRIGRGSVTVINATPFRAKAIFSGDHGAIFAAATQLRRGDEIHFLSEDDHPSLLALTWMFGAPVVLLSLGVIALALWRGGVRFGPLAAEPSIPRRSLAEQIRGTGQFALRHGGGAALRAAMARAVEEAAVRRVKSYSAMRTKDRATALATLTGFNRASLAAAIYDRGDSDNDNERGAAQDLRRTIALLETTRRQILSVQNRSSHGKR
jgi:hypothetical protein